MDEDHDTRIIDLIEKIYQEGFLACFNFFGERKASFNALYANEELLSTEENNEIYYQSLNCFCAEIIENKYNDYWSIDIGTIKNHNAIINDDDENIELFLQNIKMLWKLGSKNI